MAQDELDDWVDLVFLWLCICLFCISVLFEWPGGVFLFCLAVFCFCWGMMR